LPWLTVDVAVGLEFFVLWLHQLKSAEPPTAKTISEADVTTFLLSGLDTLAVWDSSCRFTETWVAGKLTELRSDVWGSEFVGLLDWDWNDGCLTSWGIAIRLMNPLTDRFTFRIPFSRSEASVVDSLGKSGKGERQIEQSVSSAGLQSYPQLVHTRFPVELLGWLLESEGKEIELSWFIECTS
jgi:hypothetical protein